MTESYDVEVMKQEVTRGELENNRKQGISYEHRSDYCRWCWA